MTERVCTWDDKNLDECGKPTEEYRRLYELWGQGGIGTIVLGNIPCDRRKFIRNLVKPILTTGEPTPGYPEAKQNAVMDPLSPWDAVEAFKPSIRAAKAHGSLVIGQVTHAGRVRALVYSPPSIRLSFCKSGSKRPIRSPRSLSRLRTCRVRLWEA